MSKIVLTDVQLDEIVNKTQQKFKDYFDKIDDAHLSKFGNYISTKGDMTTNNRFMDTIGYFSKLPEEIQTFFHNEVQQIGKEKE